MSAGTVCQRVFLTVLRGCVCVCVCVCVCESEKERVCTLSSRLKMTSQSEALLGPIPCSPNLQMTLGVPSTYDESLPT